MPESDEIVYSEDLPENCVIKPNAFKSQKGVVLKINGIPVGTCDVDIDDEGNATYAADFKRDKLSLGMYELMFSDVQTHNVFDGLSVEERRAVDKGVRSSRAPFRLPGR